MVIFLLAVIAFGFSTVMWGIVGVVIGAIILIPLIGLWMWVREWELWVWIHDLSETSLAKKIGNTILYVIWGLMGIIFVFAMLKNFIEWLME
jgi:hypothetical protein